jgi:perosamine synthetase
VRMVANGTVACHLCMLAMDVAPGDKVGVPALTYVATANAVRYQGAEPVFVDARADRPTTPASCVDEVRAAGARGLWIVHLYGKLVDDAPALVSRAKEASLFVVEDVAEGLGGTIAGRPAGSFGSVSAFSFYANKNITSGEGGAVAAESAALLAKLSLLLNQGVSAGGSFDHEIVGYNYRLTNLQAALLASQLERMDQIAAAKRRLQALYEGHLSGCSLGKMLPFEPTEVPWLACFVVDEPAARERIVKALAAEEIETRRGFTPIPCLKPYGAMKDGECAERFPNARMWSRRLINLPSALNLTEEQVQRIASVILHA